MPKDVSVARYFADLPDPRVDRTKTHALGDTLVIARAATVAGADSWDQVERFGKAKEDWLKGLLGPRTASRATTRSAGCSPGSTRRRSPGAWPGGRPGCARRPGGVTAPSTGRRPGRPPGGRPPGGLHRVRAWAAESRRILGQQAVADGSNEIAAVPDRLRVRDLAGARVTPDAAGCPTGIARPVRDGGGDDLLAVTGNPPGRHDAVRAVFDRGCEADVAGVAHDGAESEGIGPVAPGRTWD